MSDLPYSHVRKAKDITDWPESFLAEILGMPKSSVHAIVVGTYQEHLNARQMQALGDALRLYRDELIQGVEEWEAFA